MGGFRICSISYGLGFRAADLGFERCFGVFACFGVWRLEWGGLQHWIRILFQRLEHMMPRFCRGKCQQYSHNPEPPYILARRLHIQKVWFMVPTRKTTSLRLMYIYTHMHTHPYAFHSRRLQVPKQWCSKSQLLQSETFFRTKFWALGFGPFGNTGQAGNP